MPKPKKPRRRKDTLLYMSALQMMEGLSLIEEQGEYLELTENDHALLADLLQKAEEAGEDVIHPQLKWSDLRYVFDIQEDCNGKEAIQA